MAKQLYTAKEALYMILDSGRDTESELDDETVVNTQVISSDDNNNLNNNKNSDVSDEEPIVLLQRINRGYEVQYLLAASIPKTSTSVNTEILRLNSQVQLFTCNEIRWRPMH